MRGSRNDTISRLEGILCEVECELLYLINDLSAAQPTVAAGDDPVRRLEVARHCVSAAEKALRAGQSAGLVGAPG
jgi:hypothetical protein